MHSTTWWGWWSRKSQQKDDKKKHHGPCRQQHSISICPDSDDPICTFAKLVLSSPHAASPPRETWPSCARQIGPCFAVSSWAGDIFAWAPRGLRAALRLHGALEIAPRRIPVSPLVAIWGVRLWFVARSGTAHSPPHAVHAPPRTPWLVPLPGSYRQLPLVTLGDETWPLDDGHRPHAETCHDASCTTALTSPSGEKAKQVEPLRSRAEPATQRRATRLSLKLSALAQLDELVTGAASGPELESTWTDARGRALAFRKAF